METQNPLKVKIGSYLQQKYKQFTQASLRIKLNKLKFIYSNTLNQKNKNLNLEVFIEQLQIIAMTKSFIKIQFIKYKLNQRRYFLMCQDLVYITFELNINSPQIIVQGFYGKLNTYKKQLDFWLLVKLLTHNFMKLYIYSRYKIRTIVYKIAIYYLYINRNNKICIYEQVKQYKCFIKCVISIYQQIISYRLLSTSKIIIYSMFRCYEPIYKYHIYFSFVSFFQFFFDLIIQFSFIGRLVYVFLLIVYFYLELYQVWLNFVQLFLMDVEFNIQLLYFNNNNKLLPSDMAQTLQIIIDIYIQGYYYNYTHNQKQSQVMYVYHLNKIYQFLKIQKIQSFISPWTLNARTLKLFINIIYNIILLICNSYIEIQAMVKVPLVQMEETKKQNGYLRSLYQFTKKEINQINLRIQLALGQITQHHYSKTLKLPTNDYRMIQFKQRSYIIQQLNKIESIIHKHFSFMDSECTKPQPISKEKESENCEDCEGKREDWDESSIKIQHYNNQVQQNSDNDVEDKNDNDIEDKKISQKQQDYKKLLIHRIIKTIKQKEKINIYSQIKILKVEQLKWQQLGQGVFDIIQIFKVKYHYVENTPHDPITKLMVKKSDKFVNDSSKVKQEKQILSQFKNYVSSNIIKCYYTNQTHNNLNVDLLIDYYTFRSLVDYIKRTEKFLSLTTKIFLICQITQGMRFLRNLGIVHHDLKPNNLLIGKSLYLKITDFGQSIHLRQSKKKKSGYSFPFVAPQRFDKNQPITSNMDTFSIGILIHWLIFQQYPFIIRNMNVDKLIEEYESNQNMNRIFINQEKLKYHGPVQILRIIYTICLKCLHPNLNMRPDLDWLQIIMKRLLKCL